MTIERVIGRDSSLNWAVYDPTTEKIIATFASAMDASHFISFMNALNEFDSLCV